MEWADLNSVAVFRQIEVIEVQRVACADPAANVAGAEMEPLLSKDVSAVSAISYGCGRY
jgi:hypothetical protein